MANSSPLGEARRPPKPANQGSAKTGGNMSMAIHGTNSTGGNSTNGVECQSMKAPGSGTRGGGQTSNSASRT